MKIIPPIAVTDGGYTGPGGSVYDKNGVLQQVPANTLRLSYNPSDLTTCPGVLWSATAEENRLRYSEQADNAVWGKAAALVVPNSSGAPDGTITADSFIATNASGFHYIDQEVSGSYAEGSTFTYSVFVRAVVYDRFSLNFFYAIGSTGGNFVNFNLTTKEVSPGGAGRIQALRDGWFRCSITGIVNSAGLFPDRLLCRMVLVNLAGQGSFTGDNASGVHVWGAQLNAGPAANNYLPTTAAAVTAAPDVAATTGTLSYSSLTENDTDDGPAWLATTSYAKTNRVRRPNHKVYENVIPGIDSATPESYANFPAATKRWFELRPTNRYAPFDLTYDTQAAAPEVFTIAIRPGVAADTIAFYNLDVRAVRVQYAGPAGLTEYDKIFTTSTSSSTSWSEYLFGAKERRSEMTITGLPLYRQGVILITFWKPGSMPKVGDIVFGRIEEIGEMEWAPVIRDVDYSDTVTNDYGITRFAKGRNANVLDCDVFVLNERFDAVNRVLRANKGRPIGVLGDERFDTLQFLGFIIERSGTLASPGGSWFNLQIQGLVETDD